MITFSQIRKGDRVTFKGSNGVEYRGVAVGECIEGWFVKTKEPMAWLARVTERSFISAKRTLKRNAPQ